MIWKEIDGFDGDYLVSNTGLVKSVARKITNPDGYWRYCKDRILSQRKDSWGYLKVVMSINTYKIDKRVGKLVAEAFVEKLPSSGKRIVYKDGNIYNNNADNIKWNTVKRKKKSGLR